MKGNTLKKKKGQPRNCPNIQVPTPGSECDYFNILKQRYINGGR